MCWNLLVDQLADDLRSGFRQIARNSGFTAIAVLTFAPGIGANTALSSIFNSLIPRVGAQRRSHDDYKAVSPAIRLNGDSSAIIPRKHAVARRRFRNDRCNGRHVATCTIFPDLHRFTCRSAARFAKAPSSNGPQVRGMARSFGFTVSSANTGGSSAPTRRAPIRMGNSPARFLSLRNAGSRTGSLQSL